jgi:hypothetical protein
VRLTTMSNYNRTRFTLVMVILWMTACSAQLRTDCNARNTTIPIVPIYPESTLIEIVDYSIPGRGEIWYTYRAQETPENIAAYYRATATCSSGLRNNRLLCWGQAEPFGNYDIFIDYGNGVLTTYLITIVWDKCTSGWTISGE